MGRYCFVHGTVIVAGEDVTPLLTQILLLVRTFCASSIHPLAANEVATATHEAVTAASGLGITASECVTGIMGFAIHISEYGRENARSFVLSFAGVCAFESQQGRAFVQH